MAAKSHGGGGRLRTVLVTGTGIGMLHSPKMHAQEVPAAIAADRTALQEVYVFGQKGDYKQDASSLPKLTAPIIDVPQSITAIPAQVMQDRAAFDLNEALRNAPGVTIAAGEFR